MANERPEREVFKQLGETVRQAAETLGKFRDYLETLDIEDEVEEWIDEDFKWLDE